MVKNDPRVRITLYIIVSGAGLALVTWGIVTQDFVDAILPVVGGLLGVVGGGVAAKNVPNTRDNQPDLTEWIEIGRDALPAILNQVAQLRADLEARAAADAALPEPQLVEYVPDQAPWLPQPEYVGEHRAE